MLANHTLVASGLGGPGGLFALERGAFVALDRVSTTGLAVDPAGELIARLLYNDEEPDGRGEVLFYDSRGVVSYRRVDELREPHGALWDGDELAVVSTRRNALLWLDRCGAVVRQWCAPGDGDAWHLNNLVRHRGTLLVSAFGRFDQHRGWAEAGARSGRGIVFDPQTGIDVLTGLTCPHDPTPLDGSWLVCGSAEGELLRLDASGAPLARRTLGGWPRGLTYDADSLYVGLSAHRLARSRGTAAVVVLDRSTLDERHRWPLPCPEVFSLQWVPDRLVEGLRAGFGRTALVVGATSQDGPRPLDSESCAVRVSAEQPVAERAAATALMLHYTLENTGSATLASTGETPVHVGARWVLADSGAVVEESRDRLRAPLHRGETADGTIELWTPEAPGEYVLRLSAVQEHVRWFDDIDPAFGWSTRVTVVPNPVNA